MSIIIQGMEMPNKKNGAVLIIYPDGKCAFEDGKTYQAVPVPPHGRLIDADALIKSLSLDENDAENGASLLMAIFIEVLKAAPTIIPAEEGET